MQTNLHPNSFSARSGAMLAIIPAIAWLLVSACAGRAQTGPGTNWVLTSAPSLGWKAIASSADGARLAAAANDGRAGGGICLSTNAGASWALSAAPVARWTGIASSADGVSLAAVVNGDAGGGIYASTNSGSSWALTAAPTLAWSCIAASANGVRLVAGSYGGGIYVSADGGGSWGLSLASGLWFTSVAASADGLKLAAVAWNTYVIWVSDDGGLTWRESYPYFGIKDLYARLWTGVAVSADGSRIAAAATTDFWNGGLGFAGGICTSADGGTSWNWTSASASAGWVALAGSTDGAVLAAVDQVGGILISTNSGSAWFSAGAAATGWTSIASSADGARMAAVTPSAIYTAASVVPPSRPPLLLGFAANTLTLSWQNTGNWGLQQNDNLANSNNWSACQGITSGNGTNQLQIINPKGQLFFRLH